MLGGDLVKDSFQDDKQANDKDRDDLKEQSPLVLLKGFATIFIGGWNKRLLLGFFFTHCY